MLVLTRRPNERLIIGQAVVTILSATANRVRLGIDAPADVQILREEAADREEPEAA